MIVVVGGIKGGSGKTTIATNLTVLLSVEGKRVALVDADDQASASTWMEMRKANKLPAAWKTFKILGAQVSPKLKELREENDYIIVDSGGRDTTSQRAAMVEADTLLLPFRPRCLDIWTLRDVSALLARAQEINPRLRALSVINCADSKGECNAQAQEIIRSFESIQMMESVIGNRKSFENAVSEGRGVSELQRKDRKAIKEMERFKDELLESSKRTTYAPGSHRSSSKNRSKSPQ